MNLLVLLVSLVLLLRLDRILLQIVVRLSQFPIHLLNHLRFCHLPNILWLHVDLHPLLLVENLLWDRIRNQQTKSSNCNSVSSTLLSMKLGKQF
jgi:hypothetical protein